MQKIRKNTQNKTQNQINNSFRHTRETPRSSNDWRKIENIYTYYYLKVFSLHLNQLKAHLKGEKGKTKQLSKEVFIPFHEFILLVSYLHRTHMVQTGQQSVRVKKEDLLHNLKLTCYIASNT